MHAPARPLKGFAALLLLALPGALLICIIQCSLFAHSHQAHRPSPFLCGHALTTRADLPQPVSTGVVQALVEARSAAIVLGAGALRLLPQRLPVAMPARLTRLADSPPAPPPRRAIAR
jgi:hypothetical protein